jgi:D-alanyl-D-alanine dipeptidase
MKPYYRIAIQDCGEPLVLLSSEIISQMSPHAYKILGAPYGNKSPFYVRQGVGDRLLKAQQCLQVTHPGWRIQIFDAYRPVAVQQFMVDYTFNQVVSAQGFDPTVLEPELRDKIYEQVFEFWAMPSYDPTTPSPHSTGGAVDVTLVDAAENPVNMGSAIDELSPRSYPLHFAGAIAPPEQTYHRHRELLYQVMSQAGFMRHPKEWWHFSYGDQMWAWLMEQTYSDQQFVACYGAVE